MDKILNPQTGRYVKTTGRIGKRLIATQRVSQGKSELGDITKFVNNGYCCATDSMTHTLDIAKRYISIDSLKSKIANQLHQHHVADVNAVLTSIIPLIVPPGLKAVIFGNNFNRLVFERFSRHFMHNPRFECRVEVSVPYLPEKVDMYIRDTQTGRTIVAYNQLDLWTGGHQVNRADKYIHSDSLYDNLPANVTLVCIVCRKPTIKTETSKLYKLFREGMLSGRLLLPNHIDDLVSKFIQECN